MTLVVANISENKISINSDTKCTFEDKRRTSLTDEMLKTIIIYPYLAISFAGNHIYMEEALEEIYNEETYGLNNIMNILARISHSSLAQNGKSTIDFGIAAIINGQPKLYKIDEKVLIYKGNAISPEVQEFYLGNGDAFKEYQNILSTLDTVLDVDEKTDVAFDKLLTSQSYDDVGGHRIKTVFQFDLKEDKDLTFRYMPYTFTYAGLNMKKLKLNPNIPQKLLFGDASTGSYSLSCYASSGDKFAVSFNFSFGEFGGIIFYPRYRQPTTNNSLAMYTRLMAIKVKNFVPSAFLAEIKDRFDIFLWGIYYDPILQRSIYVSSEENPIVRKFKIFCRLNAVID